MRKIDVIKPDELIEQLESLHNQSYVFRGQPDRNFFLLPNAFRQDMLLKMEQKYPSTAKYNKWRTTKEVEELIQLYLKANQNIPNVHIHVSRLHELTIYLLQYNYYLSRYIETNLELFDQDSLTMQNIRPHEFWENENQFMYLFEYVLRLSTGIVTKEKVINFSQINETLNAYDETLPQHFGVPTAAIDWTKNPLIALFFAMRYIPKNAKQIAIFAYKELYVSPEGPFKIVYGNPGCKNPRIINQEGLFIKMNYACLHYYLHGTWPSMEKFVHKSVENFELLKFVIEIKHIQFLKDILKDYKNNTITESFLFPNSEREQIF